MFRLQKILLTSIAIGLCFDELFAYPLIIFMTHRIYSKSQTMSTVTFLDWLLKAENGFTLVYAIWIIYNG